MAHDVGTRERNTQRKERKRKVALEKRKLLRESFPQHADELQRPAGLRKVLRAQKLNTEAAQTLLVDLSFGDPFAPYELKTSDDDMREALESVADDLGVPRSFVEEIADVRKEALRAHRWKLGGRHVAFGLLGAGLFAAGGWMFAPALGAALGSAAGLGGAAATNFGLALLGGGSLAAGGAGVAGGMAVVTGVSAGIGAVGATGASVLHSLGAQGAKEELVKLQTTYKAVLLHSQQDRAKAKAVVTKLAQQQSSLEKDLARERQLNDENAERLKDLERTIEHVENAVEWMREEAA